ncbi:MAG: SMP-30/gluconolactonase/LRE family protein [Rhizobiales bacterium]|nr:SMP-30/gluconolactonase/LRE family protein [Hyphomicrobiales bacterium]
MLNLKFSIKTTVFSRLGESPVWCEKDQCIWWIDIEGFQLLCTNVIDGETKSWKTPEMPGFVVLTDCGKPAIGMESGIFLFCQSKGIFERFITINETGVRFNDATVDASGRLWAGTMDIEGKRPVGMLYSVGPDLIPMPVYQGMRTPNGLAVDETRNRLYLSDSHPSIQTIWTFSCNLSSGKISDQKIFIAMENHTGRPDGAALDKDYNYWIAGVGGGVLHRFSPDAEHMGEFKTPFASPTKLVFGNNDLKSMFVTSKGGIEPNGALAESQLSTDESICGQPQAVWKIGG